MKIPPYSKALSDEHRPKFMLPFTGNVDVSIYIYITVNSVKMALWA
jgi:hypothetical protein